MKQWIKATMRIMRQWFDDSMNQWVTESTKSTIQQINQRISESMSKWVKDSITQWPNQWIKEPWSSPQPMISWRAWLPFPKMARAPSSACWWSLSRRCLKDPLRQWGSHGMHDMAIFVKTLWPWNGTAKKKTGKWMSTPPNLVIIGFDPT